MAIAVSAFVTGSSAKYTERVGPGVVLSPLLLQVPGKKQISFNLLKQFFFSCPMSSLSNGCITKLFND